MRRFNTEAPVRRTTATPCSRWSGWTWELLDLIRAERYFALHAPRQTGKTSAPA